MNNEDVTVWTATIKLSHQAKKSDGHAFHLKTEKEVKLIAEILAAIFPGDQLVIVKASYKKGFDDWFCTTNLFDMNQKNIKKGSQEAPFSFIRILDYFLNITL